MLYKLRFFPKRLIRGAKTPPEVSGPAAAALISAGIGCFSMMSAHHLADTSKFLDKIVWSLGGWIPGSHGDDHAWGNIGSYSGKETILLVTWLLSWVILHSVWRDKQIKANTLFSWFLGLFVVATIMTWHPLFPYLRLM
ncbi:MAG: hypothetical protein N5P05_001351 [Chroococcopsis gigantea SAG 12.99]|jgi:hypothetical protein|nr:hypothetical protein [Chlorogloea purpurea SAG 13.99]MDV2999745.1 hypothetical protein [Chroococcopsis gigantea SAG 12.99]